MPTLSQNMKVWFSFFTVTLQLYKLKVARVTSDFILFFCFPSFREKALSGKKRKFNKTECNNTILYRILGGGVQLFLPLMLKAFLRGSI